MTRTKAPRGCFFSPRQQPADAQLPPFTNIRNYLPRLPSSSPFHFVAAFFPRGRHLPHFPAPQHHSIIDQQQQQQHHQQFIIISAATAERGAKHFPSAHSTTTPRRYNRHHHTTTRRSFFRTRSARAPMLCVYVHASLVVIYDTYMLPCYYCFFLRSKFRSHKTHTHTHRRLHHRLSHTRT